MARYRYEEMYDDHFEDLVVEICIRILGIGTQSFARGKDGGRDARFHGTAERFPSSQSPWSGQIVIQAKHTSTINAHFGDSEFIGSQPVSSTSILGEEVVKLRRLRERSEIDYYMIFSNRQLTAQKEEQIRTYISTEVPLPKNCIDIAGIESLERYLKTYPDIRTSARLDTIDTPLTVDPFDLAEVIEAISGVERSLGDGLKVPYARTQYAEKNQLNNLSDDYAQQLRKQYLKDTPIIDAFLADPQNLNLKAKYEECIDDFQNEIAATRKEGTTFDLVFRDLAAKLIGRDPVLAKNRRLTRLMLFYMYWNCDIGRSHSVVDPDPN